MKDLEMDPRCAQIANGFYYCVRSDSAPGGSLLGKYPNCTKLVHLWWNAGFPEKFKI